MSKPENAPVRVQLSRKKGWRMPENTVSVARPGKWGNPFRIGGYFMIGDPLGGRGVFRLAWCEAIPEAPDDRFTLIQSRSSAVAMFRDLMATGFWAQRIPKLGTYPIATSKLYPPADREGESG